MSIYDGFVLWIGKMIAEALVFIGIILVVFVVGVLVVWKERRKP